MKPLNKMDEQFYVLSDEEMATVEGGGILVGIVIVGGIIVGGTFVLGAIDGAMGARARRRGY